MSPRALLALAAATLPLSLSGCHSAYVQASVLNATGGPISLLEVDYPSASFGTQTLADGATFAYRFKILGDGPTKLLWTDAAHHEHSQNGPALREGQEGRLAITIRPDSATWQPALRP